MSLSFRGSLAAILYAILFLFFLQLLTDFIAAIYAFGLLGEGLPAELAAVVLFLTPLALLPFRRGPSQRAIFLLGMLALASRSISIFLETQARLLVSGLGVGLMLLLFPAIIWDRARERDRPAAAQMAAGLTLATALSVAFRSAGSTMDLTSVGMFRLIAWLLAAGAAVLLLLTLRAGRDSSAPTVDLATPGPGKTILLSGGLMAILTLLYFGFATPRVVARWTGSADLLVLTLSVVALVAFAWLRPAGKRLAHRLTRNNVLVGTIIFALMLALTLALNQEDLPKSAAAYPMSEASAGLVGSLSQVLILIAYPILLVAFELLVAGMIQIRPTWRAISLGFGLASFFTLLMILANVFTGVWAYIDLALEPVSRGRFWHVHFLVAVVPVLSLLAIYRRASIERRDHPGWPMAALVTGLGALALISALWWNPRPEQPDAAPPLLVAGYNVHQGYDQNGQRSHWEQCQVLMDIDADIIGLSETDTTRLAGGNFDIARYLAECLDMALYQGPRTGAGSFGYALLSKYPILREETIHLLSGPGLASADDPADTSNGDIVAVIHAQVEVAGQTFHIFVNHFDSNPPPEQPAGFIELTKGLDRVVAVGDYNCRPGGACFDIMSRELTHCAISSGDPDAAAGEVDHIFVSPDLSCPKYAYVESEASDHPAVIAEIDW